MERTKYGVELMYNLHTIEINNDEKFNTSYDNLKFYEDNTFILPNLHILKRLKKLDSK